MTNPKTKGLDKKCTKYAREVDRLNTKTLKHLSHISSELAARAMQSISEGARIPKRLVPTKLDKMEARILKMLVGWSILDIEYLLVHRVVPEAKRRATLLK